MPPTLNPSLARLRSFARQPRAVHSQCELCTARLAGEHDHVVERATGKLSCCCGACAVLFRHDTMARYRTVPRDVSLLDHFCLTDAQWQSLAIPIGLAFLFESTRVGGVTAVYPSPAGGTESPPMPHAWSVVVEQNPVLRDFAPDVEALLVNRLDGTREYFRAPIDHCYRLVGIVRSKWRGFTGGVDLWREAAQFFEQLRAQATR